MCPPKHTYTDLNFDLLNTENMTIDNKTRSELISYSLALLYDQLHNNMMKNLSILKDEKRYYNWYHGYTRIMLPSYTNTFRYDVYTSATSGHISTQHFGEKFDTHKVARNIAYKINIKPPPGARNSVTDQQNFFTFENLDEDATCNDNNEESNFTLHIEIEKISMKDLSGKDILVVGDNYPAPEVMNTFCNITELGDTFVSTRLERDVTLDDVKKQRLDAMPGFSINWYYLGLEAEPWAEYHDSPESLPFVRNYSIHKMETVCPR